jgi:hypothetical protein
MTDEELEMYQDTAEQLRVFVHAIQADKKALEMMKDGVVYMRIAGYGGERVLPREVMLDLIKFYKKEIHQYEVQIETLLGV